MIRYGVDKVTYRMRPDSPFATSIEYAVVAYGFLLNTPERRGGWWTWAEFAAMMRGYSSHIRTEVLAEELEAEGLALQQQKGG